MMKRREKIIYYTLYFWLIVAHFLVIGFIVWLLTPINVLTGTSIEAKTLEVDGNKWVETRFVFDKHYPLKAVTDWYLLDGMVYKLDNSNKGGIYKTTGRQESTQRFHIPNNLPKGIYRVQLQVEYPLFAKTIRYEIESNSFEIK